MDSECATLEAGSNVWLPRHQCSNKTLLRAQVRGVVDTPLGIVHDALADAARALQPAHGCATGSDFTHERMDETLDRAVRVPLHEAEENFA